MRICLRMEVMQRRGRNVQFEKCEVRGVDIHVRYPFAIHVDVQKTLSWARQFGIIRN